MLAIKRNSSTEIRRALRTEFHLLEGVDPADVHAAVSDAEEAIQRVLAEGISLPLTPRPSRLRKVQHTLVVKNHLEAVSVGSEPQRHLVIYPLGTVLTEASDSAPADVEAPEPDDALEEDDALESDEGLADDDGVAGLEASSPDEDGA
ncbi:R3H domain-containing nucleic acid-binding protein [Corallococcus sp. 4LFB]|uniref:R3H domain-containing nucleic acid-binding protein n=1 Tax=Corallococcus sp. 4LFB TaxID=3383249 RepID=UPI00397591D5